MRFKVTPADGNIFRDIGFGKIEAERLLLRADLTIRIQEIIRERGLTPAKAAKFFGVSQRSLKALLRFRTYDVSLDTLVDMLAHAGVRVRIIAEPVRKKRHVA